LLTLLDSEAQMCSVSLSSGSWAFGRGSIAP
jgi:hypothetical protein